MRHHHSFGAGLIAGLWTSGQPLLLITLGVALGLLIASLGSIVRWLARRFS